MSTIQADNVDTRPVRAGIIVDGLKQQAWVVEAIRDLVDLGIFQMQLVVVCSGANSRNSTAVGFLGMYAGWDRRKFKPAFDALVGTDISWMLEGARRMDTFLHVEGCEILLGRTTTEAISSAGLDVVISFLTECPADYAECRSKYGNWFFNIGYGQPYPALKEVLENEPITMARLLSASKEGRKPICQCQGSTESSSWRLNLNTSSWRLGDLLKRAVGRVYEHGVNGLELENSVCHASRVSHGSRPRLFPILSVARLVGAKLWSSIHYRIYREEWFCAVRFLSDGESPLESVDSMVPIQQPEGAFWADPFPIRTDEGYVLFVEEAMHSDRRGRIAALKLDERGQCVDHTVILERTFHMSYPFVFRYEGEFYMIPQSWNNGRVDMFKCIDFPANWEYHSTILSGEKYSDTSLFEHNGKWWLFTTPGTREILPLDDLLVFYSQTPFGPWLPHKRNPVISDARYARPAGRPFLMNGKLLRPAQDCSHGRYGSAIAVREIVSLSEDEYEERDHLRIDPDWGRGLSNTHTFNFAGNLLVLDGCRRMRR